MTLLTGIVCLWVDLDAADSANVTKIVDLLLLYPGLPNKDLCGENWTDAPAQSPPISKIWVWRIPEISGKKHEHTIQGPWTERTDLPKMPRWWGAWERFIILNTSGSQKFRLLWRNQCMRRLITLWICTNDHLLWGWRWNSRALPLGLQNWAWSFSIKLSYFMLCPLLSQLASQGSGFLLELQHCHFKNCYVCQEFLGLHSPPITSIESLPLRNMCYKAKNYLLPIKWTTITG